VRRGVEALAPALATLSIALGASGTDARAQEAPSDPDPAVLEVDGEPIARSTFTRWLMRARGAELARSFAVWRLAHRRAAELGIEPDPAAIDAAVEAEIRARVDAVWGGDRGPWLDELAREGRTEAGRRLERGIELETERTLAAIARRTRVVEDAEVEALWHARHGPGGQRIDARWIFFRLHVPTVPGESSEERRARAEELRQACLRRADDARVRLAAGEDFAAVARAVGDDSSARASAPAFDPSSWPEEARETVLALPDGALSPPIFARGGAYLVEVTGRTTTPLRTVEAGLRAELEAREADAQEVSAVAERLLAGVPVLTLPAATAAGPPAASGAPDEPVLSIGGEPVPRREYADWLLAFRGEGTAKRFAQAHALEREARRRGLRIADEDLARRVAELHAQRVETTVGDDREAWEPWLAREGRSEETLAGELALRAEVELLAEALTRALRPVTDADVVRAWEAEHGPDGLALGLRWIRVDAAAPPADLAPEELSAWRERARAEALERARDLRRRALAGEDFATLAATSSDDPETRARGGAPPDGFRWDGLPAPLPAALAPLPAGAVSEPLALEGGWLVVEVVSRSEVPLDGVRETLRRRLETARPDPVHVAACLNELLADLRVEVLPERIAPPRPALPGADEPEPMSQGR